MKTLHIAAIATCVAASSFALRAQQPAADGARYEGANLVRPADYRDWIFLSSGLDMTYTAPATGAPAPERHTFTNVFVNPGSYREFQRTGAWRNNTVLVLEVRDAASDASINKAGHFQTGVRAIEVHVKDSRFADGWAFFAFDRAEASAPPLSPDRAARCVECHTTHGAVERTFVQFYPTLLEIAQKKGTVKPTF